MTIKLPETFAELYLEALRVALPSFSELQHDILAAMMSAPQCTSSAGKLAKELGVHHVTVNSALAAIGIQILDIMNLKPSEAVELFPRPWCVVAIKGQQGLVKGFPWQLRQEVEASLTVLGLAQQAEGDSDEHTARYAQTEATSSMNVTETRRRNAVVREQCLAIHNSVCGICGIDFGVIYGPEFRDCIHVHHLYPLAMANGTRVVDPCTDLIPVCPNCHAVIHADGKNRTPAEVRALMQQASENIQ